MEKVTFCKQSIRPHWIQSHQSRDFKIKGSSNKKDKTTINIYMKQKLTTKSSINNSTTIFGDFSTFLSVNNETNQNKTNKKQNSKDKDYVNSTINHLGLISIYILL